MNDSIAVLIVFSNVFGNHRLYKQYCIYFPFCNSHVPICNNISWSGAGEFQCPCSIALNSQGHVYVCDLDNKRVQILDKDGHYIRQFGRPGTHGGAMHVSQIINTGIKINEIAINSYFWIVCICILYIFCSLQSKELRVNGNMFTCRLPERSLQIPTTTCTLQSTRSTSSRLNIITISKIIILPMSFKIQEI